MPLTSAALSAALGLVKTFSLPTASFRTPATVGVGNFKQGVKQTDFLADGEITAVNTLSIYPDSSGQGGLFLPWLTHQETSPGSVTTSYTDLGSFTRPIARTSALSWVVTGPFTGCHAAVYSSGQGLTFCHLVTGKKDQFPEPSIQGTGIAAAVGGGTQISSTPLSPSPNLGDAQGYCFWMRLGTGWQQRTIWVRKALAPPLEL